MDATGHFPVDLDDVFNELAMYSRKDHVVKRVTGGSAFIEGQDYCAVKRLSMKHRYFSTRRTFETLKAAGQGLSGSEKGKLQRSEGGKEASSRVELEARVRELETLLEQQRGEVHAKLEERVQEVEQLLKNRTEQVQHLQLQLAGLRKNVGMDAELEEQGGKQPRITRQTKVTGKVQLDAFLCPISKQVMSDPCIMISNQVTFDRASIEGWLKAHNRCPISSRRLNKQDRMLIPNFALKAANQEAL